ncbi:hypothetical protein ACFVWR_06895 [Leifsonia sp. NPDC058292]|uniref:hypothetical protein n=1 Tax=Leifsonia sp. NPDC058292 TaxID=3346428 RepID=UPI0036D7FE05
MTTVKLSIHSASTPAEVMRTLTDFSPARPAAWPSIDAEHFVVHERGASWAEVTEGTASAWERARYDWNDDAGRVTVTTHESKVFGPGGGWTFQLTPEPEGTRVDIELTRTPSTLGQRLLAALLPLVGPASFRKSFRQPLNAK